MKRPRTPLDQIEFMRNILAFSLVGSFVGAMLAFTFRDIPDANKDIITYMVGQLSGMATTVLGFFFINKVGADALDATRATNTGKLADLATKAIDASKSPDEQLANGVDDVAEAAVEKANEVKGDI